MLDKLIEKMRAMPEGAKLFLMFLAVLAVVAMAVAGC